jgi:hypothetical protein
MYISYKSDKQDSFQLFAMVVFSAFAVMLFFAILSPKSQEIVPENVSSILYPLLVLALFFTQYAILSVILYKIYLHKHAKQLVLFAAGITGGMFFLVDAIPSFFSDVSSGHSLTESNMHLINYVCRFFCLLLIAVYGVMHYKSKADNIRTNNNTPKYTFIAILSLIFIIRFFAGDIFNKNYYVSIEYERYIISFQILELISLLLVTAWFLITCFILAFSLLHNMFWLTLALISLCYLTGSMLLFSSSFIYTWGWYSVFCMELILNILIFIIVIKPQANLQNSPYKINAITKQLTLKWIDDKGNLT